MSFPAGPPASALSPGRTGFTEAFLDLLFSEEGAGQQAVWLLSIDHPSFAPLGPVYVVSGRTAQLTSRGRVFLPLNFRPVLPTEDRQEISGLRIEIDNIDRRLPERIEQIPSDARPSALLEYVLVSEPDNVQLPISGEWVLVSYTRATLVGEIMVLRDDSTRSYPADDMSAADGFFTLDV